MEIRTPVRRGSARIWAWVLAGLALPAVACAHLHIEVRLRPEGLRLTLYDFESGEADPADVPIIVPAAALQSTPSTVAPLIGGLPWTWILPQVEDLRLPFVGVGAESIPPGAFSPGQVALELRSVEGPGDIAVVQTSSLGETIIRWASRDGLPDRWIFPVGPGSHHHVAWIFGAPGTYRFHLVARGTRPGGQEMESPETTFTWVVHPPMRLALEMPPNEPEGTWILRVAAAMGSEYVIETSTLQGAWTPVQSVVQTQAIQDIHLDLPAATTTGFFRVRSASDFAGTNKTRPAAESDGTGVSSSGSN